MTEVTVTMDNFQKEVLESDKPVLIDFWASWCGPCKMLSPVISEIAEEHPEIKVCKVNVDEEQLLAMQHNIMSIPSLVVYKEGKIAATSLGFQPKESILELI